MILHCVRIGQGTPIVLLHGLFGSAANWGAIQRRLADTHDVLAMDLRNHGASLHDPTMTYPAMAADVADTLAAQGVAAAAILGHSMGGKVAMHLALSHAPLVTRLIVCDIAPVRYPPHFDIIAAALQAIPLHPGLTRAQASAALEPTVPDPALRGFLLQNLRFTAPPAWRIGLGEIAAALPDISDWTGHGAYDGPTYDGPTYDAPTYDGPVLVLRGERSDYILPEHRPLFRALFPRARFATLRGAGHWLHAEAPEAFLETIRPFP